MKLITIVLAGLAAGWIGVQTSRGSTNGAPANQILMIEASSMPVEAGKATLTVGPLERTEGVYAGDYKVKVSPYFWKNEKGRLAIVVSDKTLAEIAQGRPAVIIGTATTSGKGGATRHIDAVATPVDRTSGTLLLWFASGERKMIFQPAYHLVAKEAAGESKPAGTNRAEKPPSRPPASSGESANSNVKHP